MRLTSKLITLFVLIVLSSCTFQAEQKQTTFTVGAILSLSNNDLASIAQSLQEGIDLAVDELNAGGGIQGKTVHVIYEDDQLNTARATTAAHKLLDVNHVSASFIGLANTAKGAGPIFEQAKVPLIVLWDANEDIENLGDYVYTIGFSTEQAGYAMAKMLYDKGTRTAGVIRHQDEWSQLISNSFVKKFKELGGTILADESVEVGATDFRTVLLKVKTADAIYAPLVGQLDVLFKQARELGYTGLLTTGDSMTDDVSNSAQGAAEGVYFTQVFAPESEKLIKLAQKYRTKYGKEPELLVFTALGYDGMMMLTESKTQAKSDEPVEIHNALYKIKNYEGLAGLITMNERGSAAKSERLFVIRNGKGLLVE